jgi:GNAT superfamily N-acetyltransferase
MNVDDNTINIIPFSIDLKDHIKSLNLEWLHKYFKVEPKDERVLSDPQGEIINKGGMIFYAEYQNQIVGTVSLLKIDDKSYELTKMAVSENFQGKGIGKKLMEHCIAFANENHFSNLILYSNRILKPAIQLYMNFGFIEIPVEVGTYERADIKMIKRFES